MMMMTRSTCVPAALTALTALTLALLSGCVFRTVDVESVDPERAPVEITTPLKIHLVDGTIALFPGGATFLLDSLTGAGRHYSLLLDRSAAIDGLSLNDVVAVETYDERVLVAQSLATSIALSAAATTAAVMIVPALATAIFGSCPTIYSQTDAKPRLEAESFSNSIAPLLEMRDVDRIHAIPNVFGRLELDVRNEALETHYINHLELVEVTHRPGAFAVPAERGKALVLSDFIPVTGLTDRAGRDVSDVLQTPDGDAYRTDVQVLDSVRAEDLRDYIDLVMPNPAADTVAVLLSLRNSLLNTVLFYDFMLRAQGPRALEWLSRDINTVSTAVALGDFYSRHMRLRVQVRDGEAFREVGQVREVGPIAWSDVAVLVPVPAGNSLRIRLSFIADAWRIDRAAVALGVQRESVRRLPVERVLDADRAVDHEALANITRPDEDYLITLPGDRFWIQFDPQRAPADLDRTYFIAAQGYYTEWIRGEWLRDSEEPTLFEASAKTLLLAIQRWKDVMPSFESRFESTKIPVR